MLDLINLYSCFSAQRISVSPAAVQLQLGDDRQLEQHQLQHQQQVQKQVQQQAQKQVAGVQAHSAGRRDEHLQPYSPLNLARVKVEKSPTAPDYNQHQQAYNWLGYGQSRGQNIAHLATNPYQNYSSQSWLQAPGGQLNNYLDVDLSNYHNTFFQQQQSQAAVPEQLSDGLQQLINLQQQSIKKEPLQQQQQQPSINSQYAAQAALLEQQQQQQQQHRQQQMLQMQMEAQQQFVVVPGLSSVQPGLEEDDVKPLSKWKTKTNKSRTTCVVCSAKATGWHYNVQACEGCKAFFKRSVTIKKLYKTCTVRFPDLNNGHDSI